MTKPFSIRELQARVRTQLRRVHALADRNEEIATETSMTDNKSTNGISTCLGKLLVDQRYHQVTYKDNSINLTSTEFELLDFLCKNPDQVFSRAQLLDGVWGYNHSGYEHTVNSHINRLRNKLEENSAEPQIIQTVWGVGYKLNSTGVL
jgi:DNA-binding response OmpR family regulator